MNIEIQITDSQNIDFLTLIKLLDNDLNKRYGVLQKQYEEHNKIDNIDDVVIIYKDKFPVACGAFKGHDNNSIEIKRIFVTKECRKLGFAKLVVNKLEELAREKNYKYALLETGTKQPEAINLYNKLGYVVIENYKPYVGNDNSICMKKNLLLTTGADYIDLYDLPYYKTSSFKMCYFILYGFMTLFFYAMAISFCIFNITGETIINISVGLFIGVLGTFFAYILIYAGILHKMYIKITEKHIEISFMLKKRIVKWEDIEEVQLYKGNKDVDLLGFTLKKDKIKFKSRSFYNNLNAYFGDIRNSFRISLIFFPDINYNKLLRTIQIQMNNHADENYNEQNIKNDFEDNFESSKFKGILYSLLFSIVFGIIYGFSMYKLGTNFILIPLFCSTVIIAIFNKFYNETSFNFITRFILGLLCSVQVIVGFISELFFSDITAIQIDNILIVMREDFSFLVDYPLNHLWIIITFIICFAMGALTGKIKLRGIN